MAWFDENDLRRLAGPKSYERGLGYLDAVGDLEELPGGVTATVHGTEAYEVRLLDRKGKLAGECSCPFGRDGEFCKHCVATGLVLLAGAAVAPSPVVTDLRAFLVAAEPDYLIDLVLELATDDPVLHRRLSLRAATHDGPDVAELRRLVGGLRVRGCLDYERSIDFGRKAGDIVDALNAVAGPHPAVIGPLYRLTIDQLRETIEEADDSAGLIADALAGAVDGYTATCRVAPPEPEGLAAWILDFQVDGPGWPDLPVADFADALGAAGLRDYWRRLGELADSPVARLLRAEYLRAVAGDVDALVALHAEELPHPSAYVRIGEVLRSADRLDEAITWLRRGLAEADRPDARIAELLADLLTATGRDGDATEVYWDLFVARPDVGSHRRLLDAASRAGLAAAATDRALAYLRERAQRGGYAADALVMVLLAGGDADGAWAAAVAHDCGPDAVLAVASERARTHPGEAAPVFARRVESQINGMNRTAYGEAAASLVELRDLYRRAGLDFAGYLDELRKRHRRKRALLEELVRAGL